MGDVILPFDPHYFYPVDVGILLGDTAKAKQKLGWVLETTVQEMCPKWWMKTLK